MTAVDLNLDDLYELGSREKPMPAPVAVIVESLSEPQRPAGRPWLELHAGEVAPRVLATGEREVVWSSLWADRPDDVLVFTARPDGPGSLLRFTWLSPEPLVEAEDLGQGRFRLNQLLFRDLRLSFGQ